MAASGLASERNRIRAPLEVYRTTGFAETRSAVESACPARFRETRLNERSGSSDTAWGITMPIPLSQSPSYQEVIRGLLRMHQYTLDGQDESEEADLLRGSMGVPWERMSPLERGRVAGLSKDLYERGDNVRSLPE